MIDRLREELSTKINDNVGDLKRELKIDLDNHDKEFGDCGKKFKDLTERLAKLEVDTKTKDDK